MDAVIDFFRSIWGLWLMALFLFAVFWAFSPSNKKRFEEAANIPLNDDPTDMGDKTTTAEKG